MSLPVSENSDLFSNTPLTLGVNLLRALPILAFEEVLKSLSKGIRVTRLGECESGKDVEPGGSTHGHREDTKAE